MEKGLGELKMFKVNIEKRSLLGELAFTLEEEMIDYVLSDRDWYMKSKFKVRDFVVKRSELFELTVEEEKRWMKWKKEFNVKNDFIESLKDLKKVRMDVAHTNAFDSSIQKKDVLEVIKNFPFKSNNVYLKRDAPVAVEILAKMRKSDAIFKKEVF